MDTSRPVIVEIPWTEIDNNDKYNIARGPITPDEVQFLVDDIGGHDGVPGKGLMQPIIIRTLPEGDASGKKYRVVAGFCRFMALRMLRWPTVPCIIKNITDEEAMFLNLSENVVRRNLTMLQEAKAVKHIMSSYIGYTDTEIGLKLGKDMNWVKIRKLLLGLPKEVQQKADEGKATYEQIRAIATMKSVDEQIRAAARIEEAFVKKTKVKLHDDKKKIIILTTRNKSEVLAMQAHIRETFGNGTLTRLCAWFMHEISNQEFFEDLQNKAIAEEIYYEIPKTTLPSVLPE